METIYKTKDGKEFTDKVMAEKWESLKRSKVTETRSYDYDVISPDQLKQIFELGDVDSMTIIYRDSRTDQIVEDSEYETFSLDDTGHLNLTDYSHGLFEWSEEEQSYFRLYYASSWKVELLGIKDVSYW